VQILEETILLTFGLDFGV